MIMENSLIKDWITVVFWLIVAAPFIIFVTLFTLFWMLMDKIFGKYA